MALRLVTVVGARPQFVKAAAVSRALRRAAEQGRDYGLVERLVHTGQHYDREMSAVFFDQLGIPAPAVNLGIGSGPHGRQTGRMLEAIEAALLDERPDAVIVYGDTNSTVAAALAAAKLQIPVAHVEAGLRSWNRRMPEEINRVVTDHLSTWCFCPTPTAVENLVREGIREGVHLVGDVMADVLAALGEAPGGVATRLAGLGVSPGSYYVATLHRAENTDDPARLAAILDTLAGLPQPVLLPLHPRTAARLADLGRRTVGAVRQLEPVGYVEMIALIRYARGVLTDSGGIQKEACLLGVPCVTLRDETEWIETVRHGWNWLAGADPGRIAQGVARIEQWRRFGGATAAGRPFPAEEPHGREPLYGDGRAAERLLAILARDLLSRRRVTGRVQADDRPALSGRESRA